MPAPVLDPLPAPPGAALLLDDEPMLLGDEGDVEDDEPLAALPERLPYWSELEPAPALSRWHAVIPTARTTAASAALTVFRFIASPLGWTTTASSN